MSATVPATDSVCTRLYLCLLAEMMEGGGVCVRRRARWCSRPGWVTVLRVRPGPSLCASGSHGDGSPQDAISALCASESRMTPRTVLSETRQSRSPPVFGPLGPGAGPVCRGSAGAPRVGAARIFWRTLRNPPSAVGSRARLRSPQCRTASVIRARPVAGQPDTPSQQPPPP